MPDVKVRVSKFDQIWGALTELAKKTLPGPQQETEVAYVVAANEPTSVIITGVRKRVEDKHVTKEGAKIRILDGLGLKAKREKIDNTMVTLKVPKKLLSKEHLPTVSDGEEDVKNRASNAAIMAMLGPLFDFQPDADAKELLKPVDPADFDALNAIADEGVDKSAPVEEELAKPVKGSKGGKTESAAVGG